jgi:hypothetical protein
VAGNIVAANARRFAAAAVGVIGNGPIHREFRASRRAIARYSIHRSMAAGSRASRLRRTRGMSFTWCLRLNDAHALVLNSMLHSRDG